MNYEQFSIIKHRKFCRYQNLTRYTKQAADPYDHCTSRWTDRPAKDQINTHLSHRRNYYQRLKKKQCKFYYHDELLYSQDFIDFHLSCKNDGIFGHYALKPDSLYFLFGMDIDPLCRMKIQEFEPVIELLQLLVPTTFWDNGSSGQTLHYYFWAYMGNLYEKVLAHEENFFFDDCNDKYVYFVNTVMQILSSVLQVILISQFPAFLLENIYPSVTEYQYFLHPHISRQINKNTGEIKQYTSHKTVYEKIVKQGHLMKLPHPKDDLQMKKLLSMPVLNMEEILSSVCRYLIYGFNLDLSFFSQTQAITLEEPVFLLCHKAQEIFSSMLSEKTLDLQTLRSAHSEISSLRSEFLRVLKIDPVRSIDEGGIENCQPKDHLLYTYMSTHLYVSIDTEVYDRIRNNPNAYERSIQFLHYLCFKMHMKEQRLPTFEEYRSEYRQHIGTGHEDRNDLRRLRHVYKKGIVLFDPGKLKKTLPYITGEYIDRLKDEISQERVIWIRDHRSSCKRPITYEQIDNAAGWIYYSLVNEKYREIKDFCGKEFTVPASSLERFINKLNEKGLVKKRCNPNISKALREILLDLGWIEYLDEEYDIYNHISRRYILTARHPRYGQFVEIVGGEEEVEKWVIWGRARNQEKPMKMA